MQSGSVNTALMCIVSIAHRQIPAEAASTWSANISIASVLRKPLKVRVARLDHTIRLPFTDASSAVLQNFSWTASCAATPPIASSSAYVPSLAESHHT